MTQLNPVSSQQQQQVWNPTQNKPVVSQEQYNSTLARVGEFDGGKEKLSYIPRFFGSIFGAVKSFFNYLFCIGCCTPKLNVKIEGNKRIFTMNVDGKKHSLSVVIGELNRGTMYASRQFGTKYSLHPSFIEKVKDSLNNEGVDMFLMNFGFDKAKELFEIGFSPWPDPIEFSTKSLWKRTEDKEDVPGLKKAVSQGIIELEKEKNEKGFEIKILGIIVNQMMGTNGKIETIADLKKVWNPNKVLTSFKISLNNLASGAFYIKALEKLQALSSGIIMVSLTKRKED